MDKDIASKLALVLGAKLDAKTKFHLLDLIDERPVEAINELDPQARPFSEELISDMISGKVDYLVCDSLFTAEEDRELLLNCRREGEFISQQEGLMREGGYGRGAEYVKDKKVRGDKFIWLSQLQEATHVLKLIERLTPISEVVNKFSPDQQLDDREIQLAVYEGKGEYYLRHKDAFKLDPNNIKDGQKLRKVTVIAYLNPDIDTVLQTKGNKAGDLRLYLPDKIVDVSPRLGRVIIFMSEKVEHEVKPTVGYQRFALTTWYRHIHKALPVAEASTESGDGRIFIGIPAYRDPELPSTIKNMIETAEHPELLHFGVCFQYDQECEEDRKIDEDLREVEQLGRVRVDRISYKDARNAYYARTRVQRLHQGEEYALQIDSHMRMVKNWDSLLKTYLSQCKDPKKSIISVYPRAYNPDTFTIPEVLKGPLVMGLKEFSKLDGLPRFQAKIIKKPDLFEKPFTSLFWAAGFSFSYGTLIADCGYTEEIDDVFFGEEIYLMMKFFSRGYQLYSPPKTVIYHLWERAYRRTYKEDHIQDQERKAQQILCLEKIRERIMGDHGFIEEMKVKRGVDLVNRTYNQIAEFGGLDQSFV